MLTAQAIAVIQQARNLQEVRLQRGVLRRQQMYDALKASGQVPDSPRARWLRDTASAILDTLAAEAKKFNETTPDDLISVQDLGDALTNALNRVATYARRGS